MKEATKQILVLDDEQLFLLVRAMELGEAEEASLRLGPDAHETFVDLRGRVEKMLGDTTYAE